jgi:hypothetical protein
MAGLNNLISDTTTKATTLPTWMDQAQQNVVNMATTGAGQVPQLQNTVAGQAINTYGGANNPFSQAQNTLGQISSGAANPWITDATTGQVTPNTGTALGGLFQAQNQQLQQLMPNITAPVTGSNIASGNFGSLRGDTAYNKAMADAQAQLFTQQNQAALQNQQTGVQAAQGMGNIGAQDIAGANTLTGLQQTSPLSSAANLSKIIGGLSVPTSVTSSTQLSPLSQVGALTSALGGGTNAVNSLLNSIKSGTNISSLLGGLFNSTPIPGSDISGGYGTGTGGAGLTPNPDGTFTNQNGDIIGANGNVISTGSGPDYNAGSDTNNLPIPDYTGPAIDNNPTNELLDPFFGTGNF